MTLFPGHVFCFLHEKQSMSKMIFFTVSMIWLLVFPGKQLNQWSLFKPEKHPAIQVISKWKMPHILREISGIAWLDQHHFACVQDNAGEIFIYNSAENKIDKKIKVVSLNDFEGIAIAGTTAWLLRADGTLWEVRQYNKNPLVKQYHTFFNRKNNMEGICYDPFHKRLLLAVKTLDPFNNRQKGIYSFDLRSKKLDSVPVYKIDLTDPRWKGNSNKRKVRPSDLAVNPVNGNLFVLDGERPKLIILNQQGKIISVYKLDEDDFPLPEGITFSPGGKLFISNEGCGGKGNILEVAISTNNRE